MDHPGRIHGDGKPGKRHEGGAVLRILVVALSLLGVMTAGQGTSAASDPVADLVASTVTGAQMGEHIDLGVRVVSSTTGDLSGMRLTISSSAGLRPLTPPDGCRFIGPVWTIACELPDLMPGESWEAPVPLIATTTGFLGADLILTARDGTALDKASVSIPVDLPEVVRRGGVGGGGAVASAEAWNPDAQAIQSRIPAPGP